MVHDEMARYEMGNASPWNVLLSYFPREVSLLTTVVTVQLKIQLFLFLAKATSFCRIKKIVNLETSSSMKLHRASSHTKEPL